MKNQVTERLASHLGDGLQLALQIAVDTGGNGRTALVHGCPVLTGKKTPATGGEAGAGGKVPRKDYEEETHLGGGAVAGLDWRPDVGPQIGFGDGAGGGFFDGQGLFCADTTAQTPLGDGRLGHAAALRQGLLAACGLDSEKDMTVHARRLQPSLFSVKAIMPEMMLKMVGRGNNPCYTFSTMNKDDITLGDRIRQERKNRGLTQAVLGKLAGVSQEIISRLERGDSAETRKITAIAAALGVSAEYLDRGQGPNAVDATPSLPSPEPSPVPSTEWQALLAILTPRQQEAILSQARDMAEQNREILAYATGSQVIEKQAEIGVGGGRQTSPNLTGGVGITAGMTDATGATERRIITTGRPPGGHERRH